MKKIKLSLKIVAVLTLSAIPAMASNSDFAKFYEIDLENDPLPTMEELEEGFNQNSNYDRKYNSLFDLVGDFDPEIAATIAAYGHQEKRIKPADEDLMIEAIKQFPPQYYQYIGPQLFEVPGMSEKILNMPGIKETKHKFPTRIAEQAKNIENLHFLSPSLYFVLMPETWSEYESNIEDPPTPFYAPKIKYDPEFYAFIKKIVPTNEYMPGYKAPQTITRDDLRTLYPDANTVLTSADVKAVIATLDKVEDWLQQPDNQYQIYKVDTLLTIYEQKDELGKYAYTEVRNIVNPCARLVQKARIAGKDKELAKLVAPEGFTLNEWGYTCDKVVHAYRLSHINYGTVQTLCLFKRGVYDDIYNKFAPQFRMSQLSMMQAVIKSYQAPLRDVMAVKKNRPALDEKIRNREYEILGHPMFFD